MDDSFLYPVAILKLSRVKFFVDFVGFVVLLTS